MIPSDLQEAPFRAEARALAAILASDASDPPANSPLAIGPEHVRWFWDEVPAVAEWRRRIWRHDAEIKLSTPLIREALRCRELKRPLIVQAVDEGVFVAPDGTARSEVSFVERTRPRTFVALVDELDSATDPAVYRVDGDDDRSLVRDVPSYVRFATDVLVRAIFARGVVFDIAFGSPPEGTLPLPTFMPDLVCIDDKVVTFPQGEPGGPTGPSRWMCAGSVAEIVTALAALPSTAVLISGAPPIVPAVSLAMILPSAGTKLFDGLRRFEGGSHELPPRRVVSTAEPAKYRRTSWTGVLAGFPVFFERAHEARAGVVTVTVDASDEQTFRSWAKTSGVRFFR